MGRTRPSFIRKRGFCWARWRRAALPRHALFLGSYYGYWAQWAIPGIVAGGGRATLVDPDEQCCEIARLNLRTNGFADAVDVIAVTGEQFLATSRQEFDLVVLDAETPRDHPDPEQRGKRIYHSLVRACLPKLADEALLVCHNILFADDTGDPAFPGIIQRNRAELGAFAALASQWFGPFIEYRTTEGLGIGRLSRTSYHDRWPIVSGVDFDIVRQPMSLLAPSAHADAVTLGRRCMAPSIVGGFHSSGSPVMAKAVRQLPSSAVA